MNVKKTLVRWLCLALLVATVVGITVVSAAEPTPTATDDLVLEDMVIIVPANPTDVEKSAASELKQYLQRITGTNLTIYVESPGYSNAIYIGATEYAEAQGVTLEAGAFTDNNGLGEGWVIKAIDGNLVINGGAKRGVLYGVYHLLEDQLGVHWWNLWEEYVPTMEDATLPRDFCDSGEPVFGYRDPYIKSGLGNSLWFVRNRQNGLGSTTPAAYGAMEEFGRPYFVHTTEFYFQPYYEAPSYEYLAQWYDTVNPDMISWFLYDDPDCSNPDGSEGGEMFAWSAGGQERLPGGQVCYSNGTVRRMIKENMIKAIELTYKEYDEAGRPRPTIFDFSPNDVGARCECPDCLATIEKYGKAGYLLEFINMIAEHVEQAGYPEITIETLSYADYVYPPEKDENGEYPIRPRHNVMIRLADSRSDIMQRIDHPNNADAINRLETWRDICDLDGDGVLENETDAQLMYWGYGVVYSMNGIMPNMYRFQSLFEEFQKNGVWGYFLEIERPNNADFWDMKVWMIAKLLEQPTMEGMTGEEYERYLIRQFAEGYYGEAAADYICEYLEYMHKQTEKWEGEIVLFLTKILDARWLTAEDIFHGHQLFVEAKNALLADDSLSEADRELFLNRLQIARSGLDKVILENYEKYAAEFAENGKFFDVNKNQVGVDMMRAYEEFLFPMDDVDYTGIQDGVFARMHYCVTYGTLRSQYKQYLDQIDYVHDTNYGQPEIPEQIYEDHPGIKEQHIRTISADALNVYSKWYPYLSIEWDGPTKVVKMDYARAVKENELKGDVPLVHFVFDETNPFVSSLTGGYLNDPIVADGEYHLYRFEDQKVLTSFGNKLYIFNNNSIVYSFVTDEYLRDDKVDIYLSMKITGDPTGKDPKNYPTYYIGPMFMVEDCSVREFDTEPYQDATCATPATERGNCPVCGEYVVMDVPGTKLYHDIVGDYTWNEATKSYETVCAECGPVSIPMKAELPKEVYDAVVNAGLGLDRVFDYCTDDFETYHSDVQYVFDDDSVFGNALSLDANSIADSKLWGYAVMNGKPMTFKNQTGTFASFTYGDLMQYNGQGYHIYSAKDVVPIDEAIQYIHTWQWAFRLEKVADDLKHLAGQKMDFYASIKNSGNIAMADGSEGVRPVTNIDRIILVDTNVVCESHFPADGVEYAWNETSGQYEAPCATCGDTIILDIRGKLPQNVIDGVKAKGLTLSHVHEFDPSSFTLSYGDSAEIISINVPDASSAVGVTTVIAPKYSTKPTKFNDMVDHFGLAVYKGASLVGSASVADLLANEGEYVTYKIAEDNLLYNSNWLGLFRGTPVVSYKFCTDLKAMGLDAANLDLYLSAKVVGNPVFDANDTANKESWPVYYVDRIFVITECDDFSAQGNYEIISEADCENNAVVKASCPMCGTSVTKEAEGTALGHIASAYTYNESTGRYTSTCTRCGQVATLETVAAKLPDSFAAQLESKNIGVAHITADYPAGNLPFYSGNFKSVADADSPMGSAARIAANKLNISATNPMILVTSHSNIEEGRLTYDMIANVTDTKYHMYKIGDNIAIKKDVYHKLGIGNDFVALWDLSNAVGQTKDVYMSMKIQGGYYYIDRIILMDECSDYLTDDMYEATAGDGYPCMSATVYKAECPVCHETHTKGGESALGHSFTKYVFDPNLDTEYVAKCDYGCGATDTKRPQTYNQDKILDAIELPEGVDRSHIVKLFMSEDFFMHGEDYYYYWDNDLDSGYNDGIEGRPVMVRDRAKATDREARNCLNMTEGRGIPVYFTGRADNNIGVYSSADAQANSGKGYNWYVLEDVVLCQENENTSNFMYLFGDSRIQLTTVVEDLKDTHEGKAVDLYMRLKTEGDLYCTGGEEPKYYFDFFMVVESCPIDESKGWVITREATCAEAGEAVGNCDVCGKQNSVVNIPVLPHTIVNGIITANATCKLERTESGICTVCGQYAELVPIPGTKLTHQFTNYQYNEQLGKMVAYCDHGCKTRDVQGVLDEHEIEAGTGDPSTPSDTPVQDFIQGILPDELEQVFIPQENQNMLLPGIAMGGAAGESYGFFRDVKTSDWFYDEVLEAKEKGLIDGVTAYEFRPNETLTVAQAVKLAAALHQMYFRGEVTLTNGYGNWYDTYVDYAVENGIVGSEFKNFGTDKMNSAISRTDFVAIFANALESSCFTGYNSVADNAIPDVKMTDKNAEAIYTFYRAGILTGSDANGTFKPTSSIKRSEVAAILIRMYDTNARQSINLG